VPGARPDRPLPAASAAARTISDDALRAARDYAARNNSRALIVWRAGKVEEATYFGDATRTATFPSRSLAKPMTAVAVGRAIALGKIRSLDQPVADFVTEWKADPRRSRILVRHLLDMRSGFLPQAVATTAEDILNRAYLHPRHEEVIIHDYPVVDEPGTRYEYNNATSELVSLVLQRATGRRYAEFISRGDPADRRARRRGVGQPARRHRAFRLLPDGGARDLGAARDPADAGWRLVGQGGCCRPATSAR
jgi:CubicO group peptidase (beta-lactamase class C family)